MNQEELIKLSDEELNELSAVKVMGWGKAGVKLMMARGEWNPTNDMNDAMELLNKAIEESKWTAATISVPADNVILFRHTAEELIIDEEDSLNRAITIASILAKRE